MNNAENNPAPFPENIAWVKPKNFPGLADEEVHIWRIFKDELNDDQVDGLKRLLSPAELAKAERFQKKEKRNLFITSHAALHWLLAKANNQAVDQIIFQYLPDQKPAVLFRPGGPEFSLSHSNQLSLIALARHNPLGVDLEAIVPQPQYEQIAARFFTLMEQAWLAELPLAERLAGFYRCWTRKEALLKASGTGLSIPPETVETLPGMHSPWQVVSFEPAPGFSGALALEREPADFSFYEFTPDWIAA
jgi:4'-phosphopantetheinyl transferase